MVHGGWDMEALPAIEATEADLAAGQQRPEQHAGGIRAGQHAWGFAPLQGSGSRPCRNGRVPREASRETPASIARCRAGPSSPDDVRATRQRCSDASQRLQCRARGANEPARNRRAQPRRPASGSNRGRPQSERSCRRLSSLHPASAPADAAAPPHRAPASSVDDVRLQERYRRRANSIGSSRSLLFSSRAVSDLLKSFGCGMGHRVGFVAATMMPFHSPLAP